MERGNVKRKSPEENLSSADEIKRVKLDQRSKAINNDQKQVRKLTDVVAYLILKKFYLILKKFVDHYSVTLLVQLYCYINNRN